jgi:hypothetical protein
VRAEWPQSKGEGIPKIFDFVELPVTNILSSKYRGGFYSAKLAEQNRKSVLEQYNLLQQALVVSQSNVTFSKLASKKQDKLHSQLLTRVLLETLIFSHPCSSVVSCSVSPDPKSLAQNLTALQFLAQIREHVVQKVGRCKLNQDIVGQSIETIECELNVMQVKLEHQFASSEYGGEDLNRDMGKLSADKKIQDKQLLYVKLQELIEIYRHRVDDLREEHKTISQDEERGTNHERK